MKTVDSVQMPQNGASDQDLHCLLRGMSMQNSVKVKIFTKNPLNYKWTHPNDKDGLVHWSKKGQIKEELPN